MKSLFSALLLSFLALSAPLFATDLTITASAVVPSSAAVSYETTAGATIAAGQLIYLDAADTDSAGRGKAKLSDANGAAALRVVDGMAVNSASAGQQIRYIVKDPNLTVGGTQTPNTILVLSATAGGVAPAADVASGWYLSVIGAVKTTTTIFFQAPGIFTGVSS